MGLNNTPSAERVHIGIFGRRNAGKSSVINALTGQSLAIVSETKGTTTDPVSKAMELLPLGPVIMIDTPGIDDTGTLGAQRVRKSYQVLNKTDLALLVIDTGSGVQKEDRALAERIQQKQIPCIVVLNKADSINSSEMEKCRQEAAKKLETNQVIAVSARNGEGIFELKEMLAVQLSDNKPKYRLVSDLIETSDFVVLVVPIDKSAPKGRLILPQQQVIRDILDSGAAAIVVRDDELADTLKQLGRKPKLAITDSQVFKKAAAIVPKDILLTSFSILFARYKGELADLTVGAAAADNLKDGSKILISEGCTHHRQCEDIGTVKIPNWLKEHTGADLQFEFTSGTEFPDELSGYDLIIHCGGCMLNEREMKYRIACARDAGIPITNYGILIAQLNGILKRTLEPFPDILTLL